jgi:hypothetical protein
METGLALHSDIQEIIRIQTENLGKNVSEQERASYGFITLETSPELLGEIIDDEGILVVRVDGKLVGYLIPTSKQRALTIPLLADMLRHCSKMEYEGKPLETYNLCVLAQICIDKTYRGTGVLEALHQGTRKHLNGRYEIGIAEIDDKNPRSLKANILKAGMTDVGSFESNGRTWHVVVSK